MTTPLFNKIFKFPKLGFVLKKRTEVSEYRFKKENAILNMLWIHGVPVPQLIFSLRPFQIFKYIKGDKIKWTNENIAQVCKILKRVHSIQIIDPYSDWRRFIQNKIDFSLMHCYLNPQLLNLGLLKKVDQLLDQFPCNCRVKKRLIHCDPNTPNFIKSEQGDLFLLDWENATMGEPVYDLAFWCTCNEDKINEFMNEYEAPKDRKFWFYFLLISLWKLTVLHEKGFLDLRRAVKRIELGVSKLK